jgi:hypothetical protein
VSDIIGELVKGSFCTGPSNEMGIWASLKTVESKLKQHGGSAGRGDEILRL